MKSRGYSSHLQRVSVICDFGADHAFGQVSTKLKEHYGISVPCTASRQITEKHAAPNKGAWLKQQKESMQQSNYKSVLLALKPHSAVTLLFIINETKYK